MSLITNSPKSHTQLSVNTKSPKTPAQIARVPAVIINAESLQKMVGRKLSSETVALVNAMLHAFVHAIAVQTLAVANAENSDQSVSPNILVTVLKKVAPIHSVLTELEYMPSNLETFVLMDMTQMAMKQRLEIHLKSTNQVPIISMDAIHVLNRALNNLTYYLMDSLLFTPLPTPFQNPAMLLTPEHIAALVSQNADLSRVSHVAKWNVIFENMANSRNLPISPPMTDKSCSPESIYSSLSCATSEISVDMGHDDSGKSVLVSPPCSSILPSDSNPYRAPASVNISSSSPGSKNTFVSPPNAIKKPYVKPTDLRINTNLKQRPEPVEKHYSTNPSKSNQSTSVLLAETSDLKMTRPSPTTLLKGILRTTPSRQSPRGLGHVRLQLPQEHTFQSAHLPSKQAKSADTNSPPHRLTKFKERVLGFVRRRSLTSEETNDLHPGEAESLKSVIEEKEAIPKSLSELTRTELEVLVCQLHADVIASRMEAERARKAELMIQTQFDLLAPKVMMKIRTMEQNVAELEYVCDERRYEASKLKAELDQVLHYLGYVQ